MCPSFSRRYQWRSPKRVSWAGCWRCCSTAWPATRAPSTSSIVLPHRGRWCLRLDYWTFIKVLNFRSSLPFLPGLHTCIMWIWVYFLCLCSFPNCCSRRKRSSVLTCVCDCWGAAAAALVPSGPTPAPPSTSSWGKTLRSATWVQLQN